MDIPAFVLASLALLLTPGPTNTLLAAAGAQAGVRASVTLPVGEALGYLLTIILSHIALDILSKHPGAIVAMKALAALWLMYSAFLLWRQPTASCRSACGISLRRILVTTALNPKAIITGTFVLPNLMPAAFLPALAIFLTLSMLTGFGWITLGAALPSSIRKHSYKGAAVILGLFSIAAGLASLHV